jgi:hypothetical protein
MNDVDLVVATAVLTALAAMTRIIVATMKRVAVVTMRFILLLVEMIHHLAFKQEYTMDKRLTSSLD